MMLQYNGGVINMDLSLVVSLEHNPHPKILNVVQQQMPQMRGLHLLKKIRKIFISLSR